MYRLNGLLEFENSWFLTTSWKRTSLFVLLLIISFGLTLLIYRAGGTYSALAHLAYIPIISAAAAFGIGGGLGFAALLGLLLGPYMPLDVASGSEQSTLNWTFRMGGFLVAALLVGGFFHSLQRQLESLRRMAFLDNESGLPNRHALEIEVRDWQRQLPDKNRHRLFLLQCKIVNFGEIVSVMGFANIGQLMQTMHRHLESRLGVPIRIYRTASDEFGLLCELPKSRLSVTLLREVLREVTGPHEVDGLSAHIDVTAGVASIRNRDRTNDGHSMVRQAFLAMLHSWTAGKEVAIYHKGFEPDPERLRLLGEAKAAMQSRQFVLHYQPKLDARTRQVTGAEALIRWQHPELGLIPPLNFIPQIERTSLINPCTFYVLGIALEQAAEWARRGLQLNIAINISVRNLQATGFLKTVRKMVLKSGVSPAQIDLEITESAIVALGRPQIQALSELREAGYEISVDDFGTGYSSLAYLKSLPVTQLKIDQYFIRNLATDETDQQIVLAAISLAQRLGLKTVAEGVEDAATADFLDRAGCDKLQGYHFARPMPAAEFDLWLQNHSTDQDRTPA